MPDAPAGSAPPPILDTQLVVPTVAVAPPARRFTVGGVISRTMQVWWSHVAAFTAMSAVANAPMVVGFSLVFGWAMGSAWGQDPDPAAATPRLAALLAGWAATVVLSVVQAGAVTYGTVRHLHGERASLGRMLAVGFRRGLPVVATGFLLWLAVVLGSILLIVPGIIVMVASCLAIPAAVVERPGVVGAIRRSFALTRGSRWPLFAAGLAIMMVVWLLAMVVQVAAMVAASALLPAQQALAGTLVVSQLGNALFSGIPVVGIAVAYHDLRVDREGVDTAELARVFE